MPVSLQDSEVDNHAGGPVDVSPTAAEAGFSMPVSLTAAAWSDCVAWSVDDSRRQLALDEQARLWHVLDMAAQAFLLLPDLTARMLFPVFRVPRDGFSTDAREATLQAILATEGGEPAVTIMLRHETA
ncbi:MAG: hypothetical protein F4103_17715 [Boseongicola sp. SB0673_bin_14]|nr:hypothetical protein [Boseongicola sp. SB0673_bin_14]